jgi:glycopeptide antibiotics resistance protein
MKSKKMIQIVWWLYICLLFVIVVVKFNGSFEELENRIIMFSSEETINFNLIPLRSIGVQLTHINEWWALKNILGNIIPFGFLLPIVYNKINSFFKFFASNILFILFVESFQFFTRIGFFDVDDIFLNFVGSLCGYLVLLLVKFLFKRH